jgi:hypothetical protein
MRDMGEDLGDLRALNVKVASIVWREAVYRAPRDSGDLAVSIRPRATRYRAGVRSFRPYAAAVHWGRKAGAPNLPPSGRLIDRPWFIAPQTWAADAGRSTEPKWLPVYVNGLQDLCDRVARKVPLGAP